jgi:hypothetical protein
MAGYVLDPLGSTDTDGKDDVGCVLISLHDLKGGEGGWALGSIARTL